MSDCVHFGDDRGSQRGLLISPAQWREFIRPWLQRLFDVVRERGLYISAHSCGDIQPVLDDLEDLGVDVANPFQPEAMDVWDLFRRYKGRLTFHGGALVADRAPATPMASQGPSLSLLCRVT